MKRERFWGLYDYADGTWKTTSGTWSCAPHKRDRFGSFRTAMECCSGYDMEVRCVMPRPFYVTRKSKLTPAQAAMLKEVSRLLCVYGFTASGKALLDEFGL